MPPKKVQASDGKVLEQPPLPTTNVKWEPIATKLDWGIGAANENVSSSNNNNPAVVMTGSEPSAAKSPTKSARNRRKKESVKKRKLDDIKRAEDEEEFLEKMSLVAKQEVLERDRKKARRKGVRFVIDDVYFDEEEYNASINRSICDLPGDKSKRLFEIKKTPHKGFGIFAIKPIPKDTVIFKEIPVIQGSGSDLEHELLLTVIGYEKQRDFTALNSPCRCGKNPCNENQFLTRWNDNSIESGSGSNRRVGVYKIVSRLNHACIPNTKQTFTPTGTIVLISDAKIKVGEELTTSYDACALEPVAKRRDTLYKKFHFHCICKACEAGLVWPKSALAQLIAPITYDESQGELFGRELTTKEARDIENIGRWSTALDILLLSLQEKLEDTLIFDHYSGKDRRVELYGDFMKAIENWFTKKDGRLEVAKLQRDVFLQRLREAIETSGDRKWNELEGNEVPDEETDEDDEEKMIFDMPVSDKGTDEDDEEKMIYDMPESDDDDDLEDVGDDDVDEEMADDIVRSDDEDTDLGDLYSAD